MVLYFIENKQITKFIWVIIFWKLYNRSFMKGDIFDNLINRMVKAKPCTYKMIIE